MWKLDHDEGWVPKNWCLQTVVLERTFEHHLDSKEIKLVDTKGNHPWMFIGRTDAEVEPEILWPPDMKSQFIGKDPDAGKDWGQEEKGATVMVGWHHWSNGCEFEQAPGAGERQGKLVCCSPWGRKESDMTEQLNWRTAPSYHVCLCIEVACRHVKLLQSFPTLCYPMGQSPPGSSVHGILQARILE